MRAVLILVLSATVAHAEPAIDPIKVQGALISYREQLSQANDQKAALIGELMALEARLKEAEKAAAACVPEKPRS